ISPKRSTTCCSTRRRRFMAEPRPEILRQPASEAVPATVARPLSLVERLAGNEALRKTLIVAALVAIWQAYAVWTDNPLAFPTFTDTVAAFRGGVVGGGRVIPTVDVLRLLVVR